MSRWKVSHYYHNPKHNKNKEFTNKEEAIEEAKNIGADDPQDTQTSHIENLDTGEWGKRTWGKQNIKWSRKK